VSGRRRRNQPFSDLRVLVVEDDFAIAESLRMLLVELGCDVVGPTATVEEACRLVENMRIDVAVLDISLSPGTSAPVAHALLARGLPFLFVTGFQSFGELPEDLRKHPVLEKPVSRAVMVRTIQELLPPPA
jgi:two-component SAPR family response regulator